MPPLQRLRVTRQNGEKRAPPLRGGGLGKMGCSHDGCTQADTPRFERERSEPALSLGAATGANFPLTCLRATNS